LNRALLWVVHSKTFDGADQFTNLASRTAFRHNGQFPRHIFLLALKKSHLSAYVVKSFWLGRTPFPKASTEASTSEKIQFYSINVNDLRTCPPSLFPKIPSWPRWEADESRQGGTGEDLSGAPDLVSAKGSGGGDEPKITT
jgi:hypothetical protein